MAENKKYYTIDQKKHTVIVDTTVKPQKGDEEAVALYVKVGYDLRIKSQTRVEKMKARADGLSEEDILEALKDDKKGIEKYNKIKKESGFFSAKKWYKEYKNEA